MTSSKAIQVKQEQQIDHGEAVMTQLGALGDVLQHEAVIAHLNGLDEGLGDAVSHEIGLLVQTFKDLLAADSHLLGEAGKLIEMQKAMIEDQRMSINLLLDELQALEKAQVKEAPRLIGAEVSRMFGVFNKDAERFIAYLLGEWDLGHYYQEGTQRIIKDWINDVARMVMEEEMYDADAVYERLPEAVRREISTNLPI